MTKHGFAAYFYSLGAPLTSADYNGAIENLSFTTLSPGGYGTLQGKIKLRNARLPRPELAMFSRVALIDKSLGLDVSGGLWLGEMSDPELGKNELDGEYIGIMALGLGASLRDDPDVRSYTSKTAQQIIVDQMTYSSAIAGLGTIDRTHTLIIDQDTSQVFPDNPASVYSPVYAGSTMEDVIADVVSKAGDYSWGVWAHPLHTDAQGFPTGQLVIHQRDTATVHYQAFDRDIIGWRITPSQQRAYNAVSLGYNDLTQTPPTGVYTAVDSRLAANGGQGNAPFRWRRFYRNLAGIQTATRAQVTATAGVYLGQWKNPTNTIEITLRGLRDANGNPIPIWQARADKNVFAPSLAVRGTTLPTSPTAGVNLFYIRQTRYQEDRAGNWVMVLTCDNFFDTAESIIARMQLASDELARIGGATTGPVQALGAPAVGNVGYTFTATGAAQQVGQMQQYQTTLAQAPSSITLTAVSTTNYSAATVGVNQLSATGFNLFFQSAAAGFCQWLGTYQTVGNTLLDVDRQRGTFDWHCGGCDTVWRGLNLATDLVVSRPLGWEQAGVGLGVHCGACGYSEHFNAALRPEDEDEATHGHPHRAQQARLISAIKRHHGIGTKTRRKRKQGMGDGEATAGRRHKRNA